MMKFARITKNILFRSMALAVMMLGLCVAADAQKRVRFGVSVSVPIGPRSDENNGMIGGCMVLALIAVAVIVTGWVLFFAWAWVCDFLDNRRWHKQHEWQREVESETMRKIRCKLAEADEKWRKPHRDMAEQHERKLAEMERMALPPGDDGLLPIPKHE